MIKRYSKVVYSLVLASICGTSLLQAEVYKNPDGLLFDVDVQGGTAEFKGIDAEVKAAMKSLQIPDAVDYNGTSCKVVSVGDAVCSNNNELVTVNIGANVSAIGAQAFSGCTKIETLTLPAVLKEIGANSFYGCKLLCDFAIPEKVEVIGSFAFFNCNSLTAVKIPASVTSIGENPFGQCVSIYKYEVDADNPNYIAKNGVLFTKDMTKLISYPAGKTVMSYTVPSGVKIIGSNSVRGNTSLAYVTLPEGVEEIEGGAFNNGGLVSITLPASLSRIGIRVFASNPYMAEFKVASGNLHFKSEDNMLLTKDGRRLLAGIDQQTVNIPESVEEIDEYAFYKLNSIRTLKCRHVKKIGNSAFYQCLSLMAVDFGDSLEEIGNMTFQGCTMLPSVSFPSTTRILGNQTFAQCTNLSILNLNEGLDSIANSTFMFCRALTEVTVPGTVKRMGGSVFNLCLGLNNVEIKEGVTVIPSLCFGNCGSLETVRLPSTIKRIESSAFESDRALYDINFSEGLEYIGSGAFEFAALPEVVLPNSVKKIDEFSFAYCEMKKFTAGSGLRSIERYALLQTLAVSIELNEGLERLGKQAIVFNNNLRNITIPSTVTEIDSMALGANPVMTRIYNKAETPQELKNDICHDYSITLYVPAGSVEAYKAAPIWCKFSKIEAAASTGIDEVGADGEPEIVEIHDMGGVRHERLQPGVNICRMSDGSVRKIMWTD